jgi:RNA-dependent RNA polymerase
MLQKSSYVFGVIDEKGILKENQVYCAISQKGQVNNIQAKVIVTRNPCLDPGDIRVLEAIGYHPDFAHLTDCIGKL